jgi:hypothetical protein
MTKATRLIFGRTSWIAATIFIGWLLVSATGAVGQTGENAVYDSLGHCSPCKNSPAFFDASVFAGTGTNFCGAINSALTSSTFTAFGGVIDARGLNSLNTNMTCPSTQPSPWYGISSPPPSTILLPATTPAAPIKIPSMWALPSNTHLIGEGDSISSATTISTTIQAKSSFSSSSMIQFGAPSCNAPLGGPSPCTGISVEKLTLEGQGQ